MAKSRAQMLADLQAAINHHPEIGPVDLERLRFTEDVVMEAADGDAPLSDAILNACFPRADTNLEYVHYSRFETLESVVATGQWRLYWVFKRIFEDEYRPFCEEHNLTGYLALDPATGRPEYESMCRDLFYTSFTGHPALNENQMWNAFGNGGDGVRFVFRVHPVANRAHFRPIRYQHALLKTIIHELQDSALNGFGRHLILKGISRIGAFYLPMHFGGEEEFRILIKRFHELPAALWNVQNDGHHEYLPIPLNQNNDLCRIDLVRVDAGPLRKQCEVDRELRKYPLFAHLAPRGCLNLILPWRW